MRSVKSTTWVSKAIRWLFTPGSPCRQAAVTAAWITLGTLMVTDFYIMLVASGTISDLRFIG